MFEIFSFVLPFEAQSIQSVTLLILSLQQSKVGLPFVPDDFATCEASDGDDHDVEFGWDL